MIQSIDFTFLLTINELKHHHVIQFYHIMKSILYNNMDKIIISCLHIAYYTQFHTDKLKN